MMVVMVAATIVMRQNDGGGCGVSGDGDGGSSGPGSSGNGGDYSRGEGE